MKIGAYDRLASYRGLGERARALEAQGFDTLGVDETKNDAFMRASVLVQNTQRLEVMTGVVIAFARNPMTLAYAAHDLQILSEGRFILGLGSQVKPHIVRRFSMPWSHPARRMQEYIRALHAIWDNWEHGTPLRFDGEFYQHTLMTPMFTPQDAAPRPKVHLAAVGPLMIKVAAEHGDGLILHSFTTAEYMRDVTLPSVEAGLKQRGLAREAFEITGMPFVVTGTTEEEVAASRRRVAKQIAFYASTPTYLPVMEHHGWGEAAKVLHAMSVKGEWDAMGDVIDKSMLAAFAVIGEPAALAQQIKARFGRVFDRLSLRTGDLGEAVSETLARDLRAAFDRA